LPAPHVREALGILFDCGAKGTWRPSADKKLMGNSINDNKNMGLLLRILS